MDYKEILTEEAAEQFRKEGATHVIIGMYGEVELIRTIEVHLEKGMFCVAGKTVRSAAAMEEHFLASSLHGKLWYPFEFLYIENHRSSEKTLASIAKVIKIDPTDLEWMFINGY